MRELFRKRMEILGHPFIDIYFQLWGFGLYTEIKEPLFANYTHIYFAFDNSWSIMIRKKPHGTRIGFNPSRWTILDQEID